MSTLEFDRLGAGDPLVLVHGIGDSRAAWTTVVKPLAESFEVYAVDLPGFGVSPTLEDGRTPSPRALAAAVVTWMDEQELPTAHIVGSSLGGWVALELAALGRARTVLGLSPAGFSSDADARRARVMLEMARATAERLAPAGRGMSPRTKRLFGLAAVRTLTHSSMVAKPWRWPAEDAAAAMAALAAATGWDGTLAAVHGQRFAPPAGGIDVPVTLAWGAKDMLLPPRQRLRVHEVLPDARIGLLAGCGHLPMWDDPDLVVRAIRASAALG
ncbi:MAG: hypothetical protein QOJ32_2524 [Frankiaceae bacterium]|jgi:pimeloyl-ACP methyl ester carboxylesterase|nr:hypothetical protein [Frankiaceae bacterium]MDQ1673379.1 hypothetical protein [Frankiaceae bacterium]